MCIGAFEHLRLQFARRATEYAAECGTADAELQPMRDAVESFHIVNEWRRERGAESERDAELTLIECTSAIEEAVFRVEL